VNFDGIEFPVQPKSIPQFESQNPHLSINVVSYEAENRSFCVLYASPHQYRRPHTVNLLLLDDDTSSKRHYVWVRNMSRLVAHRSKRRGKSFLCNSCLHPFKYRSALDNHIPYCLQHPAQMVVYPDESDAVLKFEARNKQHLIGFYLICDFESFLVPAKDTQADRHTRTIDRHDVSGFCCYRVTPYEQYQTPPIVYSGPDPISKFYDHVISESHLINQIMSHHVPMKPLTSQQEAKFRTATVCRNCDELFSSHNYKVRHHDHLSGQFLFTACNNCNLQLKCKCD